MKGALDSFTTSLQGKAVTTIPKRIVKLLQDEQGKEYCDKEIATKIGADYTAVRQATRRLSKDGEIRKIKRGHNVLYTGEMPTEIETIEKEHLVEKLIEQGEFIQTEPMLHNVSYTLSVKELKDNKPELFEPASQCDKRIGGLSGAVITDILNPFSDKSITQRWSVPAWSTSEEIKGGISEKITYEENIVITFQVFGTGSVQVFIEATKNPMPIPKFFFVRDFVNATMMSRCGYSLNDIGEFLGTRFEFNKDNKIGRVDCSGKYCISLRTADALFVRTYSKFKNVEYEGEGTIKEEWLRQEVGTRDKSVPENEFMRSVEAMMMGGVNAQWMVRNQFEQERLNKGLLDNLNKLGNAVEFQLKSMQKMREEIERLKGEKHGSKDTRQT